MSTYHQQLFSKFSICPLECAFLARDARTAWLTVQAVAHAQRTFQRPPVAAPPLPSGFSRFAPQIVVRVRAGGLVIVKVAASVLRCSVRRTGNPSP